MTRYLRICACLSVVLLAASRAGAQERPWGLTISTGQSVGLLWRATERVAIRPAISWANSKTEITSSIPLPSGVDDDLSRTDVALEAAVLLSVARWNDLSAYVAPGFGGRWQSSDDDLFEQSGYYVEGMFGLEYALGERFAVFGETGLRYEHLTRDSLSSGDVSSTSFGTRARLGVIFSF